MKETAISIVKKLRQEGYSAYFAGGCVRDQLMGNTPKDYDIATSARPEQVMRLFSHTVTVGAQFGVVLVLIDGQQVEVATFRSDGDYVDGRHPDEVTYTDDARLDVLRRDFTINGLLWDPLTETLLDYVGGREDIRSRTIRTIGDPRPPVSGRQVATDACGPLLCPLWFRVGNRNPRHNPSPSRSGSAGQQGTASR